MIKCPNCGSSAQVKVESSPKLSDNKQVLTVGLVCGCGCHFNMDHERNDIGIWEHNWTFIKWIDAIE